MQDQVTTILVIDENSGDVSLLRSLLEGCWDGRFRLIHVEDLASSLEVFEKERIDAVLLDLSLPDSQGLRTFLRVQGRNPRAPVIVLSTHEDESLAMKAVQAGAQDYLVKSRLDDQLLVRSLRYAIERSAREYAEEALRVSAAQFRVAREIQSRLFPSDAPQLPGFDIAGVSFPADETGGDFFDYIPMANDTVGIAVGDVSSHGLGSALLMAETRAYLRALALAHNDVGEILTAANRLILSDAEGTYFVTLFLGRLDPRRRTLDYAAAGHSAFLVEASGATTLLNSTSLPLGIEDELVVDHSPRLELLPGQTILICTDGIHEALSEDRQMFGTDRILEHLRLSHHRTADELITALHDDVQQFVGDGPQADDITAVAIKVEAEADSAV